MLGPFSIGVIALISTGIVDTIYLGRLTDPARPKLAIMALAAMTFAFPLTFIGNSANIGLGAGTMSAVSRALGQGEHERAKRHGAAAILLGLTVMSLLVGLMLLAMPYVLRLAGARDGVLDMALQYLAISLPSLVIVSIASMSNNVLRANGEALLPSAIMISGAVINIILDPFLIFGWGPFPRMEIQGAALATLIGNSIGAMVGFYLILIHRKAISFVEMTWQSVKRAWRIIGQVGLPAAGTNIIVPVATFLAVAIMALSLSETDVAAFGVASRAELLSVGMLYALSACIGAITGRNGGAGNTERVKKAFHVCYLICLIWSTATAVILALFAPQVYGFIYTIIRSMILYIGFIFIGVQLGGLIGAYIAVALANVISGLIAVFWTLRRAPMIAKKS